MQPQLCPASRAQWRTWLDQHHCTATEVWLVFYKKHTGRAGIEYREALEEALCFGWIDGLKKRIDDERYAYRFTPRRQGSKWSPLNIRLAEKMIAAGAMRPAGLNAFEQRKDYDPELLRRQQSNEAALPEEIEQALRSNKTAWQNFKHLAPGYRKQYAGWLASAVKPETRQKRLREALRLLEQNRKLGMK